MNLLSKNFFGVKEFSFMSFGITNGCKKNLRVIKKNLAADPEIVFLRKSITFGRMAPQRPCRQRGS